MLARHSLAEKGGVERLIPLAQGEEEAEDDGGGDGVHNHRSDEGGDGLARLSAHRSRARAMARGCPPKSVCVGVPNSLFSVGVHRNDYALYFKVFLRKPPEL